jgi:hypothetical protein
MVPDFPLPFSVFGFGILALALCNLCHRENSDPQRKRLGSFFFNKKIKRGEVVLVHAVKAY